MCYLREAEASPVHRRLQRLQRVRAARARGRQLNGRAACRRKAAQVSSLCPML